MSKPSIATHLWEANAMGHPTFGEAFRFWLKLGFISFGGPTGQIAIMQTELVENKKWISQSRFLHALNFCMLLPGPEAQQLAIYVGWLLHRTWGGVVAGALFVISSMFVLWGLSFIYAAYGNLLWIAAVFYGLKPAVMAIVAFAVIQIGKKALKNSVATALGALAGGGLSGILQKVGATPLTSYRAILLGYAAIGVLLALLFASLSSAVEVSRPDGSINLQTRFGLHALAEWY